MASESSVLSLPQLRGLSKNWYFATSEAILKGNSIYDKHIASPGTRLDVEEVKYLFKTKLNKDVDVSTSYFTHSFTSSRMSLSEGRVMSLNVKLA